MPAVSDCLGGRNDLLRIPNKLMKTPYFFLFTIASISVSQAANVSWVGNGVSGDWNDTGNWSQVVGEPADLPGAFVADQGVFSGAGDSNTPTADFAFVNASNLTVRNAALITVGAGVNISNFNNWRLGANNNNGGGQVTMTGGSLSGTNFSVASSPTANTRSVFIASGGSLTTTGGFSIGELGDFNLSGSETSFNVGSFTVDGVTNSNTSEFNATFDSVGISTVEATGGFTIGSGALLNVDLTSFAGTGMFDLVTFATKTGDYATGDIMFSGLAGRTATIGSDADSLFVLIAVPEPSSSALLLSGLGLLMLRRNRRA